MCHVVEIGRLTASWLPLLFDRSERGCAVLDSVFDAIYFDRPSGIWLMIHRSGPPDFAMSITSV
jgi:hypothetical protein